MKRIIAALSVVFLTGGGIAAPVRAEAQPNEGLYGFAYNKIQFEKVDDTDIPSVLADTISENSAANGFSYYYDSDTGYMYIAVLMGEKSTGGYSVDVTGVEDSEGRTSVFVNEDSPIPGSMVPQMVTYPYSVIRARGITPNITVKSSSGVIYDKFNDKTQKVDYELIGEDSIKNTLPEVVDTINKLKENRGYYIFKGSRWGISDSSEYVLINSGMKPTLGYGIEVRSAERKNDANMITIEETNPQPGGIEGNIVTYPLTLLKIDGLNENINVITQSGNRLFPLSLDVDTAELQDTGFSVIKGYEDVSPDKIWTITFNTAVSEKNVNNSVVYLRDSSGKKVDANLKLLDNKKQVIVTPKSSYTSKETYYLFINKLIGNIVLKINEINGCRMKFTIR